MIILPFEPSRGAYEFTTRLPDGSESGSEYRFLQRWNAHQYGGWYFDVFDEENTRIAAGLKIVLGCWIGNRSLHPLFRNGGIRAHDTTNSGRDAGYDDIGKRVEVRHYTNVEIATFQAAALQRSA